MTAAAVKRQTVFGAADGVTIALGLVIVLHAHPASIVLAAFGAGVSELSGMTAGSWLSDNRDGFWPALANGGAAFAACALPAVPYLALAGTAALIVSLALVFAVAGVVSWLRPSRGALAVVETFGVLAVAGLLSFLTALL